MLMDIEITRPAPSFMIPNALAESMVYSVPQATRVRRLLANQSDLSEKEMFGGIAFLLGGNMAVGVHGEDLIVRVPPADTEPLLREPGARPFTLSGRPMSAGWLLVAPPGYATEAGLRAWVARGVAFASSLPKKTPKRKREGMRLPSRLIHGVHAKLYPRRNVGGHDADPRVRIPRTRADAPPRGRRPRLR